MINYIAFTGEPVDVKKIFALAQKELDNNSTFTPVAWVKKISANGAWGYVACADSEAELERRIISDQRGFFLINGPALRFDNSFDVAKSAMDAAVSFSPERIFESIAGSYNCAYLNSRNGLISFSDFSGTYPIYQRKINNVVVVSNRASSIACLEPRSNFDLMALSWLVGHSNIFGENTPYEGVFNIKPGTYLKSNIGSGNKQILKFNNEIWPSYDLGEIYDDLKEREWEEIVDELLKNVKGAANQLGGKLNLSLTGGKDSRLTLALALGAGLKDSVSTFTRGPEDSPEIACAASVAKLAGVQHQARVSTGAKKNQDFEATWKRLRQHNFRYESYICPWDGAGAGLINSRSMEMTGFGGELYRGPGGHAKQFKNLSFLGEKDLLRLWTNYHQRMDPLNLLRTDYKIRQINWLREWLELNEKFTRKDVLPEKFFVENRLSHWNGPLAQNVVGKTTLMPLLSPRVAKLVFRLTPESRAMEIFHYSVMAKIFPDFISHPFLNASWNEQLKGRMGLYFSSIEWGGCKVAPRSIQAWQFEFLENQRDSIVDLLEFADQKSNINIIVDVRKAIDWIKRNNTYSSVVDAKIILSLIGISHSLTKGYEVVKDTLK